MIEITNLKKSFGNHVVLQGVSLSVARGEVVCLIGPSGSGKSTVLRCINGLESYDAGEVSVFGKRVDRTSDEIHKLRGSLGRSEEHASELQSLMRISYAVFCLKKKKTSNTDKS